MKPIRRRARSATFAGPNARGRLRAQVAGRSDTEPPSQEQGPATPFLFIPVSGADDGRRPAVGPAWIASPSIFLLNENAEIEHCPRVGVAYRILVVVGNSGNAPVLNGFAEYY